MQLSTRLISHTLISPSDPDVISFFLSGLNWTVEAPDRCAFVLNTASNALYSFFFSGLSSSIEPSLDYSSSSCKISFFIDSSCLPRKEVKAWVKAIFPVTTDTFLCTPCNCLNQQKITYVSQVDEILVSITRTCHSLPSLWFFLILFFLTTSQDRLLYFKQSRFVPHWCYCCCRSVFFELVKKVITNIKRAKRLPSSASHWFI